MGPGSAPTRFTGRFHNLAGSLDMHDLGPRCYTQRELGEEVMVPLLKLKDWRTPPPVRNLQWGSMAKQDWVAEEHLPHDA